MLKARRADLSALYRRLCHDGAVPGAAAATDAGVALGSFVAAAERGGMLGGADLHPPSAGFGVAAGPVVRAAHLSAEYTRRAFIDAQRDGGGGSGSGGSGGGGGGVPRATSATAARVSGGTGVLGGVKLLLGAHEFAEAVVRNPTLTLTLTLTLTCRECTSTMATCAH